MLFPWRAGFWQSLSPRAPRQEQRSQRPDLERLEDRTLFAVFTAASTAELIAAINAANQAGGSSTITLAAGQTFSLTAVNNDADGPTGLPFIAANDNLTINGNGATIARSTEAGTPAFRLFNVVAGASLTLQDLTLQGGLASGADVWAAGGAIFSQGALKLTGVTLQGNVAQGGAGIVGSPGNGPSHPGGPGGAGRAAFGGALYIAGGTATLTGDTLSGNLALGGNGGAGGNNYRVVGVGRGRTIIEGPAGNGGLGGGGFGGALFVAAGTVTLQTDTLTGNIARGGSGGLGGRGAPTGSNGIPGRSAGSDIFLLGPSSEASVSIDPSTQVQENVGSAPAPAPLPILVVSGFPSSIVAGTPGSFMVTVLDPSGQPFPGYTGTVSFWSSDPEANLPPVYTFTAADQGVHPFTATLADTFGTQTLQVQDTGVPGLVGFQTGIVVSPAVPSQLQVLAAYSGTAGQAVSVTVTAVDWFGNLAPGYAGTIHFSSSDPQAVLPRDYTFTPADNGVHTFSIVFETAGGQNVTATDTSANRMMGTSGDVSVDPAAASQLVIAGAPTHLVAGSSFSVTVRALDPFNNLATGYSGTVHFSSSDPLAVLPSDATFFEGILGIPEDVTLKTPGSQTVAVTDTTTAGLTGTSPAVTVQAGTASAADLIAAINAANQAGGSNTITLQPGVTITLTAVNNTSDGATGLPVIAANDNLTILGNGAAIVRSTAAGTPAFRLFDVAAGGLLTLQNLTLQGGLALGKGPAAQGGAVLNRGTLDLNGVTATDNTAQGQAGSSSSAGPSAAGGALWSSGQLTLEGGSTLQSNLAVGGSSRGTGGDGRGGGLYIAGGSVFLNSASLTANMALGGSGSIGKTPLGGSSATSLMTATAAGGNGFGGGLYAAGGTLTLFASAVSGNSAGGAPGGQGVGGGFYLNPPALAFLDAATQQNILGNQASTRDPGSHGIFNTATTVADLLTLINAANLTGGANTITLAAGKSFLLTAAARTTYDATGLPAIALNDQLTILGNGDTIARSGLAALRLFAVDGSLTLRNLKLQNGQAAYGGAIYVSATGSLDLDGVTVQGNSAAQGGGIDSDGVLTVEGGSLIQNNSAVWGGGIYSTDVLTVEAGARIQNNQAVGRPGNPGQRIVRGAGSAGDGSDGLGGGLYVENGSATFNAVTLSGNIAQGGAGGAGRGFSAGGAGGSGLGAGLYINAGTVSLLNIRASGNSAQGGRGGAGGGGYSGGSPGMGLGGGIFIRTQATVVLDTATKANVNHNRASTTDADISGPFTLGSN